MVRKIRDLRIMREERSVGELAAPVLVVSQFTLYGDARKGRGPRGTPPRLVPWQSRSISLCVRAWKSSGRL